MVYSKISFLMIHSYIGYGIYKYISDKTNENSGSVLVKSKQPTKRRL